MVRLAFSIDNVHHDSMLGVLGNNTLKISMTKMVQKVHSNQVCEVDAITIDGDSFVTGTIGKLNGLETKMLL